MALIKMPIKFIFNNVDVVFGFTEFLFLQGLEITRIISHQMICLNEERGILSVRALPKTNVPRLCVHGVMWAKEVQECSRRTLVMTHATLLREITLKKVQLTKLGLRYEYMTTWFAWSYNIHQCSPWRSSVFSISILKLHYKKHLKIVRKRLEHTITETL